VATFWLAFGAALGLLGLLPPPPLPPEAPFRGRAVVLVPICDEEPGPTFARIRAIDRELRLAGLWEQVDLAVLSDTRAEATAVEEALEFQRLVAETGGAHRIFYRRRASPRGRKAGNIEDFVRRSGRPTTTP
jgi:membrane glycosyltransferase